MKKYILIIFGNFTSDDVTKEIAENIAPIVDSAHLKFQRTDGSIIFHFASEVSQEEIHDYLVGTLFDLTNVIFLTEYTDKVSFFLPQDIKEHLFDLENSGNDVYININLHREMKNDKEFDEEDFVALLLDEVKRKVKKPSLDTLLDKINKSGHSSLTQFEKDSLDEYSKNL